MNTELYNMYRQLKISDSVLNYCTKIEENLKNDPDFVTSYEESKKKALAEGKEFVPMSEREITALIAYLQRLGTDVKVKAE